MAKPPTFAPVTPDGALAGEAVAVGQLGGDHLNRAVALDREINRLTAQKACELHAYRVEAEKQSVDKSREWKALDSRAMRGEIAAALHVTERAVEHLLDCSATLVEELPATLTALESGSISYRHVLVLVDETMSLSADDRTALESKVLASATEMTPSAFRRKVRVARERLHPESIQARHDAAQHERGLSIEDLGDGLATLHVTAAAPLIHAAFGRITDAARGMRTPQDARTTDQRRSDLVMTVLLSTQDGVPFGVIPGEEDSEDFVKWFRSITPEVFITVPALTLLGSSDEPAMINGLVPIDPDLARILVGNADSFTRILTHPEYGTVLSVGRARYKIPKDLRRYLLIRDLTCRFPGCYQPASRCDLDHTVEWQHLGQSDHSNLAFLCRGHHMVKGKTGWDVEQDPGGSGILTWTSPDGRTYRTYPGAELAS